MIRWYKKASGEVVLQEHYRASIGPRGEISEWRDVPTEVEKQFILTRPERPEQSPEMKAAAQAISESVSRHMADIAKYKDEYIKTWLAETGCLPSECILVEKRVDQLTTKLWMERREVLDDGIDPQSDPQCEHEWPYPEKIPKEHGYERCFKCGEER